MTTEGGLPPLVGSCVLVTGMAVQVYFSDLEKAAIG